MKRTPIEAQLCNCGNKADYWIGTVPSCLPCYDKDRTYLKPSSLGPERRLKVRLQKARP